MLVGAPRESAPDPAAVTGRTRATVLTYVVLLLVAAAAWAHVLFSPTATDDMSGMDVVMTPTVVEGLAFVGAWGVMMAAMMLPSALPMMGLYAATQRNTTGPGGQAVRIGLFTLTYLGLWALTGVPIYFASVRLSAISAHALANGIAGVLVVAGSFKFWPPSKGGRRTCPSPPGF